MSKNIYIFSGLGADERAFQKLDFKEFNPTFVNWISPLKNESLENYCKRLLSQIKHDNPILIGLSFGGLVAIEVSKLIPVEKIILLSSMKTRQEIPVLFRALGKIGIHKIISASVLKKSKRIAFWIFGAKTPFERDLLTQILKDIDPIYLKWAIDKIVNWKNNTVPINIFHIHGDKDVILPIKNVKCDAIVKGGSHLMLLSKSEEVSEILQNQLNSED